MWSTTHQLSYLLDISLHSHSPKQVFKVLLCPKHLFFYTHLYVYKGPWGGVTHQRVLKNIENLAVCGQISGFVN